MKNRMKAVYVAIAFLGIEGVGLIGTGNIPLISSAQAQAEYRPTKIDFFGKWKLTGAAVRPPKGLSNSPTPEEEAAASEFQQTVIAFYRAFDYLEIKPNGQYNFHQPGDPSGLCVYCGTWKFEHDSLWLSLPTVPRLDIYAKDGNMQMTYNEDPGKTTQYKWQVLGWTKLR
jgi:hypothetical protein